MTKHSLADWIQGDDQRFQRIHSLFFRLNTKVYFDYLDSVEGGHFYNEFYEKMLEFGTIEDYNTLADALSKAYRLMDFAYKNEKYENDADYSAYRDMCTQIISNILFRPFYHTTHLADQNQHLEIMREIKG